MPENRRNPFAFQIVDPEMHAAYEQEIQNQQPKSFLDEMGATYVPNSSEAARQQQSTQSQLRQLLEGKLQQM